MFALHVHHHLIGEVGAVEVGHEASAFASQFETFREIQANVPGLEGDLNSRASDAIKHLEKTAKTLKLQA